MRRPIHNIRLKNGMERLPEPHFPLPGNCHLYFLVPMSHAGPPYLISANHSSQTTFRKPFIHSSIPTSVFCYGFAAFHPGLERPIDGSASPTCKDVVFDFLHQPFHLLYEHSNLIHFQMFHNINHHGHLLDLSRGIEFNYVEPSVQWTGPITCNFFSSPPSSSDCSDDWRVSHHQQLHPYASNTTLPHTTGNIDQYDNTIHHEQPYENPDPVASQKQQFHQGFEDCSYLIIINNYIITLPPPLLNTFEPIVPRQDTILSHLYHVR